MEIKTEIVVNASAAAAWIVVGERFHHVSEWATPIRASSCVTGEHAPAVGSIRACELAGFGPVKAGIVKEQLLAFDPEGMSLTYAAIEGMPSFMTGVANRLSIHAQGEGRCLIRQHATFELTGLARVFGFLFKWQMTRRIPNVLDDLRHMIETGAPSACKAAATRARSAAVNPA
jgi:hypothetical protein